MKTQPGVSYEREGREIFLQPSGEDLMPHPFFDYDPAEDIDIPYAKPVIDGPDCPFCGDPTMLVDGDFICLACNGGWYGPEVG